MEKVRRGGKSWSFGPVERDKEENQHSSQSRKGQTKDKQEKMARQEFFRDPYRYARSLLEPPKSGTLTISQAELEACLTKTYTDAFRNSPLSENWDF